MNAIITKHPNNDFSLASPLLCLYALGMLLSLVVLCQHEPPWYWKSMLSTNILNII